jgi:hypothetical protein
MGVVEICKPLDERDAGGGQRRRGLVVVQH